MEGKHQGKSFFMNTTHDKPSNGIYSASNSIKPVNFFCSARGAKTVQLAGDFNHWHPILMAQREDSWWFIQMWLPHGHHPIPVPSGWRACA